MSQLLFQLDAGLSGAALTLTLLGFGVAAIMPGIDRRSRRFFMAFFMFLVLYAGLTELEWIFYARRDMQSAMTILYYLETLCASATAPLMTAYLLHCCGENRWRSPLYCFVAVLWILFFIAVTISVIPQLTPLFFHVGSGEDFSRGPLYPLITVPMAAMQLLNLAGLLRRRKKLSKKTYHAFFVGIFPVTLALFAHLFVSVFRLLAIGMVICALSMYVIILSDQIGQYLRQQQEIADQRASIMVLQMRPHFIYNTMISIYYLCKQDPDLAQRVTLDFTTYLRKNFTAIAKHEPIPFSEELEHTRAYLAVEKAKYPDTLFVDYDTPCLGFLIPPLTLQPIVENAVKHGMIQAPEPLHILVRTRSTDFGSEITVENTGADFRLADDSEPHIALKNIQQRLEMMCRGKMTITPREGGGTVVTVTIPR